MRAQVLLAVALCGVASVARADLAGMVYRIDYESSGVEDCLRFADDGSFAADSSLLLPAGHWAQRGPTYTAHQNDATGNTFTWGGAEPPGSGRLIGAFVSSFGIRLGFAGAEDPDCEVSFDERLALVERLPGLAAPIDGDQIYELRSPDGATRDCFRLSAAGEFVADSLSALGLPAGAWHRSGVSLAAYQSGPQEEAFSVNSWGGLTLAGGVLWIGVHDEGVRIVARANPDCGVSP
ncbi:MAG: hypothetical protein AAGA68_07345 [Pseudomonadota bacterium]